jgi:hypothetical protein
MRNRRQLKDRKIAALLPRLTSCPCGADVSGVNLHMPASRVGVDKTICEMKILS